MIDAEAERKALVDASIGMADLMMASTDLESLPENARQWAREHKQELRAAIAAYYALMWTNGK